MSTSDFREGTATERSVRLDSAGNTESVDTLNAQNVKANTVDCVVLNNSAVANFSGALNAQDIVLPGPVRYSASPATVVQPALNAGVSLTSWQGVVDCPTLVSGGIPGVSTGNRCVITNGECIIGTSPMVTVEGGSNPWIVSTTNVNNGSFEVRMFNLGGGDDTCKIHFHLMGPTFSSFQP